MKSHGACATGLAVFVSLLGLPSANAACPPYVTSATWGEEAAGGGYFAGKYPSLQVTLDTACTVTAADADAIADELVASHGNDTQWTSPKLTPQQMRDSVKFQLECHLGKSPVAMPLTLEPRRQGTSTKAYQDMANCNTP